MKPMETQKEDEQKSKRGIKSIIHFQLVGVKGGYSQGFWEKSQKEGTFQRQLIIQSTGFGKRKRKCVQIQQ